MTEPRNVDAVAAEWVRRKEFGDWDDCAGRAFQAWLEQSVSHRVAYLRLEEGWQRTERLAALRLPEFRRATAPRGNSRWTKYFQGLAAAAAIAISILAGRAYFPAVSEDTYATPVGGREILTLFDGSHVELNTDTVVRLAKHRRSAILLKGEAFFQIKHDANHPFVVMAAGHRITDLGTKFSVRDAPGKLEVAVLEGKAKIENIGAASSSRVAILTPGDVALATAGALSVTSNSIQTLANDTAWRHGVVIFRHMALADAANEFNRYNLKQLIIDPKVANLAIDGTFATDNLETFARIARSALGLRIENREHEILITR